MRAQEKRVTCTSFYCEKTLKLFFRLFSFMPRFIFNWNGFTLNSNRLCSTQTFWFSFNFLVVAGLLNTISVIHVIIYEHQHKSQQLMRVTIQLAASTVLAVSGLSVLISCRNSFVVKCQQMKLLYTNLVQYKPELRIESSKLWKTISRFLNVIVVLCVTFPALLVTARNTARNGPKDPMGWSLYQLYSCFEPEFCTESICTSIGKILLIILQLLLSFVRSMELVRTIIVLYIVILYFVEMQLTCLRSIEMLCKRTGNYSLVYRLYNSWRVAKQEPRFQSLIALLMAVGFFLFASANINTVKWLREGSSWKSSIQYPISACISGFLTIAWLDTIASVSVHSSSLIRKMLRNCLLIQHRQFGDCIGSSYRRLIYKQWKSVLPVSYSCGSTFHLRKGIDIMYVHLVMLRTIEGILLSSPG